MNLRGEEEQVPDLAVRRRVSEWELGRRSGEDIYPKNGVKSGR
jgi:hypothetical protein